MPTLLCDRTRKRSARQDMSSKSETNQMRICQQWMLAYLLNEAENATTCTDLLQETRIYAAHGLNWKGSKLSNQFLLRRNWKIDEEQARKNPNWSRTEGARWFPDIITIINAPLLLINIIRGWGFNELFINNKKRENSSQKAGKSKHEPWHLFCEY